jgi:hypothetical protein
MSEQKIYIKKLLAEAKNNKKRIKKTIQRLKKLKNRELDDWFHQMHDEVFEEIDCLDCANCCKSISPTLYDRDIERLAKAQRMKPSEFVSCYTYLDDEGDYVFKNSPCPFLLQDNYCQYYLNRPKACRAYPHSDRRKMHQIMNLTAKNALVCPAIFLIIKRMNSSNRIS